MKELERMVAGLVANNTLHRNGLRLQDMTTEAIIDHLVDEMGELSDAVAGEPPEPRENQVSELADVHAILIHVRMRLGISETEIEQEAIRKIKIRFTDGVPDAW